ncbi:MAG: helix-turn-helix domain-containing protein, partial [Parahaliea sp.]
PLFGLLLAQRQQVSVLGDLPMIASRATTVGGVIAAINRFLYLHASGVRIESLAHGDRARVVLSMLIDNPQQMDQLLQVSVGQSALYIASLLNVSPYSQAIHLRQPEAPPAPSNSDLRFQNVRYRQDFDGVSLPRESLQRPSHHDEETLTRHLQGYLVRLKALYPNNFERQVAEVIGRLLPSGECAVAAVAATLNVSPRALQERLKAKGTGYREILRQTRHDLAIRQLSRGDASITELALQLGYADVAVFSRHFKAWTGLSPRAWRRTGQATPD